MHWEDTAFAGFDVDKRLSVDALGNPQYQQLYRGYEEFSCLSANVFEALCNSDQNVFISALRGSGKTTAAEFAILREHSKGGSFMVLYIVPYPEQAEKIFRSGAVSLVSLERKLHWLQVI